MSVCWERSNENLDKCLNRDNHGVYRLRVSDEASRVMIAEVSMSGDEFTKLVTGVYMSDLKTECSNTLDRVGKERVFEKRQVVYPTDLPTSRDDYEAYLKNECQEEGWFVDPSLRSQSSVGYKDGNTILNYSVYKFVKV